MHGKILAIIALLFLAGCGVTPVKNDLSQELKASNIAVAYYMTEKKVTYSELVYKVLWNQTETQEAEFGSLWDIDREVSRRIAGTLANENLMSAPIQDILKSTLDYKNFETSLRNNPPDFDTSRKPFSLDDQTSEALKKANIRYLILERSPKLVIQVCMGDAVAKVRGSSASILTVYDVNEKKQVYDTVHFFALASPINANNRQEVENDDLKVLKESAYQWINNSQAFYAKALGLEGAIK
jgi:hypothetical protein